MVYSKRLVGPTTPGAGFAQVATVPSGKTWLIKYIVCRNGGGATSVPALYNASALSGTMYQGPAQAVGDTLRDHVWVVYRAGEAVVVNGTGNLTYSLYGYELDNV